MPAQLRLRHERRHDLQTLTNSTTPIHIPPQTRKGSVETRDVKGQTARMHTTDPTRRASKLTYSCYISGVLHCPEVRAGLRIREIIIIALYGCRACRPVRMHADLAGSQSVLDSFTPPAAGFVAAMRGIQSATQLSHAVLVRWDSPKIHKQSRPMHRRRRET